MNSKPRFVLWLAALMPLTPLLLASQAPPDYLTEEEVQKVRDTQEPDKRILLFLQFAVARLAKFEQALTAKPPTHPDDLTEIIDHYINAVDDAASNLEIWLDRGGVDLSKARKEMEKQAGEFVARLEKINETQTKRLEDFRFTWDDSLEATREFLEIVKKIPEGMIPPKQPPPTRADEEKQAAPGQPTLRKKEEPPPKPEGPAPPVPRPKPPEPKPAPPPQPPPLLSYGPAGAR